MEKPSDGLMMRFGAKKLLKDSKIIHVSKPITFFLSSLVSVCYNTLKFPLPFEKSILFCCKKHSKIMFEDLITPISEIFPGTDV